MDGAFDDEAEPAVTISEYLDEVEERELVSHFLHSCCAVRSYLCEMVLYAHLRFFI